MGGNKKQAQRTKGNVKPSSSARAAELLANTSGAGATLGFVGFSAMSGDLGYVPAVGGSEDGADLSIEADFRMVLRKLSKRDATTKIKALQEFSGLCQEKDSDSVKSVLPFWPRIYSKVTIDHDRRVREAAQEALKQLVIRVHRSLAPHLKTLMGPWLVAQCDLYAPAASVAQAAFAHAFPPAKQVEAVMFCKEEVLTHLQENLFVQSATTLSDCKTTEAEDREAKYFRLLSSSLAALRMFITMVTPDQQTALVDTYRTIFSNPKLWKFAKHSQTSIVGALYSVLAAVCQREPGIAAEFGDKLCPVILHNLDNTDPVVCPSLWEAALSAVSGVQDCWLHVNPRKGVLPRLWTLLRCGGEGSAVTIYPNMLPFLSHIPSEIIGEAGGFYSEFFSNFKTGLCSEKVAASPSESGAIVRAFMECLRFCLSRNLTEEALVNLLVLDQLMPLLASSILEVNPSLGGATPLYAVTFDLLAYLAKTRDTTDSSEKSSAAENILRQIFTSIEELHVLESENRKAVERYATFLQALTGHGNMNITRKKTAKVSFVVDDEKPAANLERNTELDVMSIGGRAIGFEHVCKACKEAYNKSLQDKSVTHLAFVSSVMKSYTSADLVEFMWGDSGSSVLILKNSLQTWMSTFCSLEEDLGKVHSCFCDVILTLFSLCPENDKRDYLSACLDAIPMVPVFQQLIHSLHQECSSDPTLRAWFKGEEFGRKMVAVVAGLCQQSLAGSTIDHDYSPGGTTGEEVSKDHWEMFNLAFWTFDDAEPLLGEKYLTEILSLILRSLPAPADLALLSPAQLEYCILFICDVAKNFFSNVRGCLLLPPAEDLLYSVFQLSCQSGKSVLTAPPAVLERVEATWRLGVRTLVSQRGGLLTPHGFLGRATALVKNCVLQEDSIARLRHKLVPLALALTRTVTDSLPGGADSGDDENQSPSLLNPTACSLLQEMYLSGQQAEPHGDQWTVREAVMRQLTLLRVCETDVKCPTSLPTLVPCVFSSSLLRAVWEDYLSVSRATVAMETTPGLEDGLLLELIYGMAYCRSLHSVNTATGVESEFSEAAAVLAENISFGLKVLSDVHRRELVQQAIDKSLERGQLWSKALQLLLAETKTDCDLVELCGGVDRFSELTEAKLHTLQVILPHVVSRDTLQLILQLQAAQILTCPRENLTQLSGAVGRVSVISQCVGLLDPVLTPGDEPDSGCQLLVSVLDVMKSWRNEADELFLFDSEVQSESWAAVTFTVAMVDFQRILVNKMASQLSNKSWDFILCSLVAWVQSCSESQSALTSDPRVQTFGAVTFDLLREVALCVETVAREQLPGFPESLVTEWREFFSEGAYSLLLPMFVNQHDVCSPDAGIGHSLMLQSLGAAVALCPLTQLQKHQLPARLTVSDRSSVPDSLQTALNHLCPLLLSSQRALQLCGYRLLTSLMPELSQYDETPDKDTEVEEDKPPRGPPCALMSVLDMSSHGVELLLKDVAMDEPVTLETHGDEYTVTMGYLLSWKLILCFFRAAKPELRAEYATYLRDHKLVESLMVNIFKLMPMSPTIQLTNSLTSQLPGQKLSGTKTMFAEDPLLDIIGGATVEELPHLACSVYSRALNDLPAIIRQWYNDTDKKTAPIVNRYTSSFVSPVLCSQEIAGISQSSVKLDNMAIRTRPAAREVVASYTVDEVSVELVVALSQNHPLGPITVECGKRIGVATNQWRTWLLQLTTYLQRQNGSILDGLSLWKRNVDKRFEGVEECMICFSVIHGSNFQVPKLQCRTCKKRFHSACLYKWFNMSNKSSCPTCRNLF